MLFLSIGKFASLGDKWRYRRFVLLFVLFFFTTTVVQIDDSDHRDFVFHQSKANELTIISGYTVMGNELTPPFTSQ
jgi:hypothetical protein